MSSRTAYAALPVTLPPLSRALVSLALAVARWEDRRRTRSALARLDSHILADIGLTSAAAQVECRKPFWRD
ncbi:DUF1127 domain-containing protein [Rhodobacteraceae bacterium HSP-20]|jgi:uncharacterized protein YjiS (DUF1127 family)|uniref:DUF1127 domain-containing protein n=1 Tax=Paragemmobacter amnigenus TaxID=2852097 RepID=A0ABS6IY98_9RHOB|nr:DUF1127 domain-containing protein [Rhodobacter amnigenus]MBU9696295.1 DUF1127 domain-containing protein [Rhodobacter amnigenus]MBV4387522.1 DUF1127 domain-containing protein [Rhodobacter amnigenus]